MSNNQIVCGRCGRAGHIRTDCIMPIRGLPNMTEILITCPALPEIPRVYRNVGGLLTDYRHWNQDVLEWTRVFEDFITHVEKLQLYFACSELSIAPTSSEDSSVAFQMPDTPEVREFYERVFVNGIDPYPVNQPPRQNPRVPDTQVRRSDPPRANTPFHFTSPGHEVYDNDGQSSEDPSAQGDFSSATSGAEDSLDIEEEHEDVEQGRYEVQHGHPAEVTEESEEESLFVN